MKKRSDYPRPSLFGAMTPERTKRFWSKVDRSGGDDACHPWTGALQTGGYGQLQWSHNSVCFVFLAHRVAWALTYGFDPGAHDQVIRHNCGDRRCCNPRHLVSATWRDVWLDTVARGQKPLGGSRSAFGKYGADACAARYGWEERDAADRLRNHYGWPLERIAAYFGCSLSTAYRWTTPP